MAGKEFVICNLCNSNNFKVLYTRKHYALNYQIVKCKTCGLIYMNPRFSEEKNRDLYNDTYYYFGKEDDEININKAVEQFKRLQFYSAKGRLLEIGCAKGFFLKIARDNGWETYGVDLSDYGCKFAKEQFNLNVLQGVLEEIDLPEKYFDVVSLWDTLEHLRDPCKVLEKIKRLLKDDGILMIETPNINSVFFKLYRRYWLGFNPFHLYYFSPQTLKNMLCKLGFTIVNSETITVSLFSIEGIWDRGFKTAIAEILSILWLKDRIKKAVASVRTTRPSEVDFKKWGIENLTLHRSRFINLINYPADYLLTKLKMGDHLLTIAKN